MSGGLLVQFGAGVPVDGIARRDGVAWSALGAGLGHTAPPYEIGLALAEFDDATGSALYVGGLFETAGGKPSAAIAKWAPVRKRITR